MESQIFSDLKDKRFLCISYDKPLYLTHLQSSAQMADMNNLITSDLKWLHHKILQTF
jgi:hypothetical protein